jgi:hypothetical protein
MLDVHDHAHQPHSPHLDAFGAFPSTTRRLSQVSQLLECASLSELNGYILDELESIHGEASVRVLLCSICTRARACMRPNLTRPLASSPPPRRGPAPKHPLPHS